MLSPNEYMIGVCLGITVGACILAHSMSHYYRGLNSICTQLRHESKTIHADLFTNQFVDDDTTDDSSRYLKKSDPNLFLGDICSVHHGKHKNGNLYWIQFWSGLVFWWNVFLVLIMA